jgi:hypothetical protein
MRGNKNYIIQNIIIIIIIISLTQIEVTIQRCKYLDTQLNSYLLIIIIIIIIIQFNT